MIANAIDKLKKICPYAATQTVGDKISVKSGLKNASNPVIAPGNVTALITIIKNTITNVGIMILLAISIPRLTPRMSTPKTMIQTTTSGRKTPGTKLPNCPGTSANFK